MNWWRIAFLACIVTAAWSPGKLHGQEAEVEAPAPLEEFVQRVARLWSSGEVASLLEMIPEDNRFMLDTGAGIETANARHAAAALRALFDARETLGASAVRVTVSGSEPARGFGEISWRFRARGAPGEDSRSVYVGARWEGQDWRITELRVMP